MQQELDYANAKTESLEHTIITLNDSIVFLKESLKAVNYQLNFVRDSAMRHEMATVDSIMKHGREVGASVSSMYIMPPEYTMAWLDAANDDLLRVIKVLLGKNKTSLNTFLSKEKDLGPYDIAQRRISFILKAITTK